ncbi:MAG: hypothetical protein DMG98_15945 [Acidobacteria bacterium]|nr:MAG: hypothetical protein DMG98_15945 [Acidobacteriota bacterium]
MAEFHATISLQLQRASIRNADKSAQPLLPLFRAKPATSLRRATNKKRSADLVVKEATGF